MESNKLQLMDITSLCAVLEEFRKDLLPSKFEKAQQPDKSTLQLGLRTFKNLKWIEISWLAEAPRIVEIPPPSKNGNDSTLAKQFQHLLSEMALVEIKQDGFERIIELMFTSRPGERILKTVVIEIMGRHSNILLLDEHRKIITLGRQIRKHQSRLRPISTGDTYSPPPSLKGIQPCLKESFDAWKKRLCLIPSNLKQALQNSYQGISPSLSLQMAGENYQESSFLLSSNVRDISDNDWQKVYKNWLFWLNSFNNKNFILSFNGPTSFNVWKPINNEQLAKKYSNKIALSIGIYYKDYLDLLTIKNLTNLIKIKISKLKKSELILLKEQEFLLNKTSEITFLQNSADALLSESNPSKIKIKEAQKLYERVKKLRRSIPIINQRIKYHQEKLNSIDLTKVFLEGIINNNFEENSDKIKSINLLKQEINDLFSWNNQNNNFYKGKKQQHIQLFEISSPNGLKIQIGRNHRQNEFISLKKSRNGDLWFHAQECPGSHIILKTSNGTAGQEDLQMAANLAALFSRAKGNKKVAINVVPTSQLQRINGGIPGSLIHKGGEILWGEPLKGKNYIQNFDEDNNF